MKKQVEKKKREKFNARIPTELKRGVRVVSAALNWKVEEMTVLAVRGLLGVEDRETAAKLKKVRDTAKALNLSFSLPGLQPAGVQLAA